MNLAFRKVHILPRRSQNSVWKGSTWASHPKNNRLTTTRVTHSKEIQSSSSGKVSSSLPSLRRCIREALTHSRKRTGALANTISRVQHSSQTWVNSHLIHACKVHQRPESKLNQTRRILNTKLERSDSLIQSSMKSRKKLDSTMLVFRGPSIIVTRQVLNTIQRLSSFRGLTLCMPSQAKTWRKI